MKKLYTVTGKSACYFLILLAWLFAAQSFGTTRYVNADGLGDNYGGTDWNFAYKTLKKALEEAAADPSINIIYVASGTYYPTGDASGTDRNATFLIPRGGLSIIGVPFGGDTPHPDYPVYLSGDIGTPNNNSDNSYHVMVVAGLAADAAPVFLEGLTFTKGNANGTGVPQINGVDVNRDYGGGLFVRQVLNTSSFAFVIRDCRFIENNAGYGGAGMLIHTATPVIENIVSSQNTGLHGGGIYCLNAAPYVNNSFFTGNNMTGNGGGVLNVDGNPKLTGCVITGNKAGVGGGIYNYNASPTITNCTVAGNTANDGGSIYNTMNSNEIIINSIVYGNNQDLFHSSSTTTASYSLIQGMSSTANNNIDGNLSPQFLSPVASTNAPTIQGDYRIKTTSPGKDVGNNAAVFELIFADAGKNDRIFNGTIDLGAFEQQPCGPQELYVDASVPLSGDGSSWQQALKTLNEAFDKISCPDIKEIHVAQGSYTPGFNRGDSFVITKGGLKIYGGYPSGGGERNAALNTTTMSGYYNYHVLTIAGVPAGSDSLVIDGFTISGGEGLGNGNSNVNGYVIPYNRGGGVYVVSDNKQVPIMFRNCSISNNRASDGGGMYATNVSLFIQDTRFESNTASGKAGALYAENNINLTIKKSYFQANRGNTEAGALFLGNATAWINASFQGNAALSAGAISSYNSSVELQGSLLTGSDANMYGAIFVLGGNMTLVNCTIASNDGPAGAFRAGSNATVKFRNTIMAGNTVGITGVNGVGIVIEASNSLIQGLNNTSNGNLTGTTDPLFINAPAPSTSPNTGGDFRVSAASPVIDRGDNAQVDLALLPTDLRGAARIVNGTVDMGAYEFDGICPVQVFVDSSAVVSGDGTSWAQAVKTLGEAIDIAACGTTERIFVAKGTYYPTGEQNGTDRDATFMINRGTFRIIGGYPSGGGTRNRTANPTILSGDIGTLNDRTDNSYHILTVAGLGAEADSVVVDGITIADGNANGSGTFTYNGQQVDRSYGGGINLSSNNNNAKILLRYVKLTANEALRGGAVASSQSSPAFFNNLITGNKAGERGSAIYGDASVIQSVNNTIASNNAVTDATVDLQNNSALTMTNTVLHDNSHGVVRDGTSTATISYSLVQGESGTANNNLDGATLADFQAAANFSGAPTQQGNYGITADGAVINAGNAGALPGYMTTDMAGNARLQNSKIDMGAYEQNYGCLSATLYVDASAANPGSGASWARPFRTLSEAVAKAAECTSVTTILIAKGTYYPTGSQTGTDRDATFGLYRGGLKIIGGYPNGGGDRDLAANPVILSGNIGSNASETDNSFHVMVIAGLTSDADSLIIDGITVTEGYADQTNSTTYNGISIGRQYGAGIFMTSNANASKVVLKNLKATGNYAKQDGGGFYVQDTRAVVTNSYFQNNRATYGAGTYNNGTSPDYINCVFQGNNASNAGGGLFIVRTASNLTLVNCLVTGNVAGTQGGGMLLLENALPVIINSVIAGNRSTNGGAASMGGLNPVFRNTIIYGNSATSGTHGLYESGASTSDIANSIVQGLALNTNGNLPDTTDPLFVNLPAAASAPTLSGDFHIQKGSPAGNAGNNSFLPAGVTKDLDGNARINDDIIDMGAFELPAECIYPTLYVDSTIAASGNGASWATAYKTLGEALAWADKCSNVSQILIAKGTYYPTGDQSGTDRNQTFGIFRGGLRLLGGYPPGGGTRNIAQNKTVLSGDIGVAGTLSDNSAHVVVIAGLAAGADSVVIDGFQIVWGTVSGFGPEVIHGQNINQQNGGGIYMTNNNQSGKIVIRQSKLFGNSSDGGGLYIEQSAPVLIGNDIFANDGGAIRATSSTVTLINNTIAGNNAATAAVNMSSNSTLNVYNTIIYNNNAGIAKDGTSTANLSHSLVQGESSTANGNIDGNTNPLFTNSFIYQIAPNYRGDYTLTPASPAIDKGDNSLLPACIAQDVNGNTRVQGGTVDMGAYERTSVCALPNRYVDAGVSASGDGTDWAQAFKTLDEALAATQTCPGITTIRVAKGTYYPGGIQGGTNRDATFAITRGNIRIEGGYPTGGGTRDITTNTTTLSGDIGTAVDAQDNAYHVMAIVGVGAAADSVVIEGFTVTAGNANGAGDFSINSKNISRGDGAGITMYDNTNSGKIRISSCRFTSNLAPNGYGGGIAGTSSAATITNCVFSGNQSQLGAGIYNGLAAISVTNTLFEQNSAASGGAIYNSTAASKILDNTFTQNEATSGGAVFAAQQPAAEIARNAFNANHALEGGGAIANSASPTIIRSNTFTGNISDVFGGAIYNSGSAPIISSSTFRSNQSPSGGAIANMNNTSSKIINSVFQGNSGQFGGAIFNWSATPVLASVMLSGNKASSFGGAIYNQTASPAIINATIAGNFASFAGAMYNTSSSSPTIGNSIIAGNNTGVANDGSSTPTISFSFVQDMPGGTNGNLDGNSNPLFSNPQNPATAPSILGDYRVGDGSEVINAGFNDLVPAYVGRDLDSLTRISTLRVDMGAYEHNCPPVLATSEQEVDRYLHTGQNFIFDACTLLAGIAPAGAQPVSGMVTANARIDANIISHGAARFVRRYYDVAPTDNAENATATITLFFAPSDFQHYNTQFGNSNNAVLPVVDGDNVSKLKVVQYHGQGNSNGDPASYDAHVVITPTSVTYNPNFQLWEVTFPVTGFSGFFVSGQSEDALPVTLIAFKAEKRENDVKLDWKTSEETASAYFEIQRSTDASSFDAIGKVNAKGQSNEMQSYAFIDTDAANSSAPNLYYRLKMVDTDGTFAYSKVVAVRPDYARDISIYPNPLVNDKKLSIEMPGVKYLGADLLNARGNKLKSMPAKSGGKLEMQLGKIPAGTYVLRITADGKVVVRKIVVQ